MRGYIHVFLLVLPFCANALPLGQSQGNNDIATYSQQYQYTKKALEGFKLAETKPCIGKTKNKPGESCEEEYQVANPKVQVKEPETPTRPATLPTNPKKPATLPAKPARPAGGRR